jgi:hypothetical protein
VKRTICQNEPTLDQNCCIGQGQNPSEERVPAAETGKPHRKIEKGSNQRRKQSRNCPKLEINGILVVLGQFDARASECESEDQTSVIPSEDSKTSEKQTRKWRVDIDKEDLLDVAIHKISKKGFVKQGIWGVMKANKSKKHAAGKENQEEYRIKGRIGDRRFRLHEIETTVLVRKKMTNPIE